jgi:hypothetical protein
MDEWGPWDHESPLVRALPAAAGEQAWEVLGVKGLRVELLRGGAKLSREPAQSGRAEIVRVRAAGGVTPYELSLRGERFERVLRGTIVAADWEVVFFAWKPEVDPRKDLAGWRKLAEGADAVRVKTGGLDFNYGWRGPKDLGLGEAVSARGPGGDHFGMIARTTFVLPAGRWRLTTLSDDGIRVVAGGRRLIENWTWHGPTKDEAVFEQRETGEVELLVEHFEIDGYAVLRLDLEPAP